MIAILDLTWEHRGLTPKLHLAHSYMQQQAPIPFTIQWSDTYLCTFLTCLAGKLTVQPQQLDTLTDYFSFYPD